MPKSELLLNPGEEIKGILVGELYAISTNPLVNLVMKIVALIDFLIGHRRNAQITVTDKRIVFEAKERILWIFPTGASFRTILPHGVESVEYAYVGTCCWCLLRKYMVAIHSVNGESVGFIIKGGAKVATEFCNLLTTILVK